MPEPGAVRQPEYQRGDKMAYGQATQANRQSGLIPQGEPVTPEEQFMFSETFRPNEPITAGVPFGPGQNAVLPRTEKRSEFIGRIAKQVQSVGGDVPPQVLDFLRRVEAGE